MTSFTELQQQRRTIYGLGRNVQQTPEELFDLVKSAVRQAPTAFNNQTVRSIV
ncbi:MAG: nitroreductase, partial [Leuconostoc falkenbergense]